MADPLIETSRAPALPEVSVIVPTRDRPAQLARCLGALARTVELESWEVIVVDDGSRDVARVGEIVQSTPMARLVRARRGGPAAARNTGVRAARAAVVCFTDDDCEPHAAWASQLRAALERGAEVAAGRTENASADNTFAAASQTITNYLAAGSATPFAATNNLACWTKIVRALPFDETFPTAAGEDRDWCARLLAAGHALTHEPAAVVIHRQQLDAAGFVKQQLRYGRGAFRFKQRHGGESLESGRFRARLIAHALRRGVHVGSAVVAAQLLVGTGYLLEAAAAAARRSRWVWGEPEHARRG